MVMKRMNLRVPLAGKLSRNLCNASSALCNAKRVHCHIDHVGRIPYLLMAGFKGPIFTSIASASLLPLVIEDALKVGVTRDQKISLLTSTSSGLQKNDSCFSIKSSNSLYRC